MIRIVARLFVCVLMIVSACSGELVTIGLHGVVDELLLSPGAVDPFGGEIAVGSTISGHYCFESTTLDINSSDKVGDYEHTSSPCGVFLNIGVNSFQTDMMNTRFLLELVNDYPQGDAYLFRSYYNVPLPSGVRIDHIRWQLVDYSATALSSDILPLVPPDLSLWDQQYGLWIEGTIRESVDVPDRDWFIIKSHVTEVYLIPEPLSLSLLALGGLVLARRRRQR